MLKRKLKKHLAAVKNFRHTDEDILPEQALKELDEVIANGGRLLSGPAAEPVKNWLNEANEVVKCYNPHGSIREILDILAVALMVAFGIRALFFQPFKIPTSSMQPTLYGIHYIDSDKAQQHHGVSPLFGKLGKVGNYLVFASRKAELELKNPVLMGKEIYPVKEGIIFDSTLLPFSDGSSAVMPGVPSKVVDYMSLFPGKLLSGKVIDGFLSDGDHLSFRSAYRHAGRLEENDPVPRIRAVYFSR